MNSTIAAQVVAIVAGHVEGARLDVAHADDIRLDELGLSSAEMINLIIEIEDAFNLDVDDEYIHSLRTVGDVVRAVDARAAGAPSAP